MVYGPDEQRAVAKEARRVQSALESLAGLAEEGRRPRRAAAPPMLTVTPPPRPSPFAAPPPAFGADSRPDIELFPDFDLSPQVADPVPPPVANGDWFGDTEPEPAPFDPPAPRAVAVSRPAPFADHPAALPTPPAGAPAPEPARTAEAINDVLDGFEW